MKRTILFLMAALLAILLIGCTNNSPGTSSSASITANASTFPTANNSGIVSSTPSSLLSPVTSALPGLIPSGSSGLTISPPGIS